MAAFWQHFPRFANYNHANPYMYWRFESLPTLNSKIKLYLRFQLINKNNNNLTSLTKFNIVACIFVMDLSGNR